MTEQRATGLAAYEMVSMVVGSGQLFFYNSHERARVKARALHGLVFRLPIFEDYRPRPDSPLPGWDSLDPWAGTGLADPNVTAATVAEVNAVLADAGIAEQGAHGVSELAGERDGLADQVAALQETIRTMAEALSRTETERDDALAHLHQATQPPARELPDRVGQTYAELPPIGRTAALALTGPESYGDEPPVPTPYPAGFTPPGEPWCPPRRVVPELGGTGPVGGYALGRGVAVPDAVEEERSEGLAFHR